jgi:hypothetical protein
VLESEILCARNENTHAGNGGRYQGEGVGVLMTFLIP